MDVRTYRLEVLKACELDRAPYRHVVESSDALISFRDYNSEIGR